MVSVEHRHSTTHPCLARDTSGNLRDECGTGTIIVPPFITIEHVEDWIDGLSEGRARDTYLAAVQHMRTEDEHHEHTTPARAPLNVRVDDAHRRLVALRERVHDDTVRRELDDAIHQLES